MKNIIFTVMMLLMVLAVNSYADENLTKYEDCVSGSSGVAVNKPLQEKFSRAKILNGVKYHIQLTRV